MHAIFRTALTTALTVAGLAVAGHARADITFYENDGYGGRSFTAQQNRVRDFNRANFNDRASSVVVTRDRWEVCEDVNFDGRCVVLRPGQYASLRDMGLNDRLSSARRLQPQQSVEDNRYAPEPLVARDFRRRSGERLYEVPVSSVRAVMGQPEQRCWVEQREVPTENRNSVPGGLAGAVIGGILGHQIGGGTGRDIATAGGVVGGAIIGSRIGGRGEPQLQDVRRCENAGQARPAYYDVTYTFRGQEHHTQMTTPPASGRITVNREGEPRA